MLFLFNLAVYISNVTDFQVINNNLNPQWKPFDVKVQKLCAGNYDVLIKVSFNILFVFILCSMLR